MRPQRFTLLTVGTQQFSAPDAAIRLHVLSVIEQGPLPGMQRLRSEADLTHDLLVAPAYAAFTQLAVRLDAVHIDTIAGSDWARALGKLCRPGATLTATQLSDVQRHALSNVGFAFETPQQARFQSRKPERADPENEHRRAMVLGAGVAGCAVAQRLCARGWDVTLLDQNAGPAQAASGNLAGIFMPILSKDDAIPTRLTRAAFLFALRYWDSIGGVGRAFLGAQCGVLHLARDAGFAATQREIDALWRYPAEFARWLEAGAASDLIGHQVEHGGWLFPQAGWARPSSVCEAMLRASGPQLTCQFGTGPLQVRHDDGQWRLSNPDGRELARAPLLVCATGAAGLPWLDSLPLARIRGQVSHLSPPFAPALPMAVCREAYITPLHDGIACAGASYDDSDERELSAASHADNLARAGALLGLDLGGAPLAGRVGFRSVAPDRLPLLGAVPDAAAFTRSERLRDVQRHPGLYAALGYASRGMIWAPLMAELLASRLHGDPLPLEASLADALDPARFLLRARRRDKVVVEK